jgi:hypothetical protein
VTPGASTACTCRSLGFGLAEVVDEHREVLDFSLDGVRRGVTAVAAGARSHL